jgi:hypothetical protein
MPLQVTKWIARVVGEHGHSAVLPFDHRYNGREYKDRIRLSEVGRRVSWEIFVDFARPMDPGETDYPHYARLEDEGDLATLSFNAKWSSRAGVQWGLSESSGPVPTTPGVRRVRITLLNAQQQPLLSQSGTYHVDAG